MTPAHTRASFFLEGEDRHRRAIITPEGVSLPVDLATVGERLAAFAIDVLLQLVAATLISFVTLYVVFGGPAGLGKSGREVIQAVLLLITFVIWNLYFIHFELAWRGATPGKRAIGLRVIDRRGGPLLPSAVIARNLTRQFELFMPAALLLSLGSGPAPWAKLSLTAWFLTFALLPLFNRDRLRGGDLIAGTTVIALPRRVLLGDLVEQQSRYRFTERQLNAYGAFELQVLETLLRRPDAPDAVRLRRDVCDSICRKIEWRQPVGDTETLAFLTDFYTAQRARLEREQLYGRPRADKHYQEKAEG